MVLEAIREGALREPERLMGFVRTVARRLALAGIRRATRGRREKRAEDQPALVDHNATPERHHLQAEEQGYLRKILGSLPQLDREIISRFYLQDQTRQQICTELSLTAVQFRLRKSRAKSRLCTLVLEKVRLPASRQPQYR